jgi:short-subunit dehydrogenase
MNIADKVVIITGASAGIGQAAARTFTRAGARVALVARSADKLAALAEELRQQGHPALAVSADMRDPAAIRHMVDQVYQHYGQIDILVNNAGQAASGTVAEVSVENFQKIVELNVFGPVYAIQAVVPKMRQNGGGIIINVSSMVSKMRIPGLGAYAATKAALNMLSDTARGELAADHIRVITVYPRMTATDFGKNSLGNQEQRQQQRAGAHAPTGPAQVVDSAEHVAGRILAAAQAEPEEQFME